MDKAVETYLDKFEQDIRELFNDLRNVVFVSANEPVEEKLWAKLPSYYVGDCFVRLIPFKDHINIEAAGLARFISNLNAHRFTPKGMLQLKATESIPREVLLKAFHETFYGQNV